MRSVNPYKCRACFVSVLILEVLDHVLDIAQRVQCLAPITIDLVVVTGDSEYPEDKNAFFWLVLEFRHRLSVATTTDPTGPALRCCLIRHSDACAATVRHDRPSSIRRKLGQVAQKDRVPIG